MIKKLLCVFLVFTFLICTFSACSGDEEINVIYPIAGDPGCLDPQIAESGEAVLITRNCMEGLVRLGENGEILPGVAESWNVSADGRTYVFNIRQDAMWQKLNSHKYVLGEDFEKTFDYSVTAEDCAFGIIRALRPETKAENAYLLYSIENAVEVNQGALGEGNLGIFANGTTLTIKLSRSNPDFLRILTYPMCMPCSRKFFEATGAKYGLELKYTLCNGPFYVGNWVEDSTVTLYKSETYRGENPSSVSAMYFNVNADEGQVVSKFNQGDYNAIPVKASYLSEIDNSKEVIKPEIENTVSGLLFNFSDLYLANDSIRKALVLATDMNVLDNSREYAAGVIPPSCRWGGKSYRESAGAAARPEMKAGNAMRLFFEGVEELEISNVNLSILCTETQRDDIVRLIQNWQKFFGFSITVSAKVMAEDEIEEAVSKGEYQIAVTSFKADDASAIKFLEKFCTGSAENKAAFSSTGYDTLIQKCMYIYEGNQILGGMKTAENYLISNGVFYPLYNSSECFAYRDEIGCAYPLSEISDIDFTSRVTKNAE